MIDHTRGFAHLQHMSDQYGVFEHAELTAPRRELGYCADDMARVLVVTAREPHRTSVIEDLEALALDFVCRAQQPDGQTKNRRSRWGQWEHHPSVGDCWGRSLWGLGVAASTSGVPEHRDAAMASFDAGSMHRPPWSRTMAFAALGASEVLRVAPGNTGAAALLTHAVGVLSAREADSVWDWPDRRLTYANAAVPEALIAAGSVLGSESVTQRGLDLLGWLLEHESHEGHLSVTPVGGAGPRDLGPRFDQQPIEVAALADACARAFSLTGDPAWSLAVTQAGAWFDGANDRGAVMWDPVSGGGYDGLHGRGPNLNQGAESTLAFIATGQRSAAFAGVSS